MDIDRGKVDLDALSDEEVRALVPELLTVIQTQRVQISQLQRMIFGRRSEKARSLDTTNWLPFKGLEELRAAAAEAKEEADQIVVPAHERRRGKRRREFPDDLPRVVTTCTLTEEERLCPHCNVPCDPIGQETTREIERIETTFVHEIAKTKYACRRCESHVVTAEGPGRVLDKCMLGPGFLAQILFERFGNHMPYARLEKKYAAEGFELSRSVLCSSAMRCAELLEPVFDAHVEEVLGSLETSVLQADDTVAVQRNGPQPGRKDIHVWAWRDQHAGVFYTSSDSRTRASPAEVLGDRRGRLQCDGHDCFSGLDAGRVVRIGCWAHVRRYFEKARRLGDPLADDLLRWIQVLFQIERVAKQGRDGRPLTDEELVELRQEKSAPILAAIRARLEELRMDCPGLPKGPLMEGVRYALNQWPTLERFLADGRIREISNNGCERALRVLVIGRKNWIFFGSEEGTDASLRLLSLVQSCREHRINPLLYLRDVLREVSTTPASRVRELTPLGWKRRHQEACRREVSAHAVDQAVRRLLFSR